MYSITILLVIVLLSTYEQIFKISLKWIMYFEDIYFCYLVKKNFSHSVTSSSVNPSIKKLLHFEHHLLESGLPK